MSLFGRILVIAVLAGIVSTAAQSQSFEEAATLLRDSCAKDIEEHCYGVNPGNARLKSCIARNSDSIAPVCRADYPRAYAMISKRAQDRGAVLKLCADDIRRFCPQVPVSPGQLLECAMGAPKDISRRCTQALTDAIAASNVIVNGVTGLENDAEVDLAALRKEAQDRAKKNADRNPVNRPPISEALGKLPQFTIDIQFKADAATIAPSSYPALGRIADALLHPHLTDYRFLIVSHMETGGRRDENLLLSQRRAEAIRETLVTVFSISGKRIEALGLGEEQFADRRNPKASTNQRVQFAAVGKVVQEATATPPRGSAKPRAPTRGR